MRPTILAPCLMATLIPFCRAADPPLRDTLYAVLEDGTAKYNGGDKAACRAEYRTALLMARPSLPPDLQAVVDDALAREPGEPTDPAAAHLLRRTIDKVRAGLKTPPAPPLVNVKTQTTCGCQQGGTCLCMQAGMACHCTPSHSHVFTSDRYHWQTHKEWAELMDGKTGKQVGGYLFGEGHFYQLDNGVWSGVCDPPIPPPPAPAKRVSVQPPVPYHWIIHPDWAELLDMKTVEQAGGLLFDGDKFYPFKDGAYGEQCDPPIALPTAARRRQVDAQGRQRFDDEGMPTFPELMRMSAPVQMCAGRA